VEVADAHRATVTDPAFKNLKVIDPDPV